MKHPEHRRAAPAARPSHPAAVRVHPRPAARPAIPHGERERREQVRIWAKFMIVHLERSDFEQAGHYTYEEALERLKELIDRELKIAREDAEG